MSKEGKVRLSLELATTVRERLERLRDRTDAASMTEVIRRAIEVYVQVVDSGGGKPFGEVTLIEPDGSRRKLVIIL